MKWTIKGRLALLLTGVVAGSLWGCTAATRVRHIDALDPPVYVNSASPPFDEKLVFDENNYIFIGEVLESQEIEIQWNDASGDNWGPFYYTVFNVKPVKEYHSELPQRPDTIEMICNTSTRELNRDSYRIETGGEYIFIAHIFDENDKKAVTPRDKLDRLELYQYADVVLRGTRYYVLPIVGDRVFHHAGFHVRSDSVIEYDPCDPAAVRPDFLLPSQMPMESAVTNWEDFDPQFAELVGNYKK